MVQRRLQVSTRIGGAADWPGLAQVCRLTRTTRHHGRDQTEVEYAITSVPREQAGAAQILAWWRGHWGIENRSHYVRDVAFREDACQIKTGYAPQNLAALRNALISMLRLSGHENITAALRQWTWQTSHLLAMLGIINK